MRLELTGRRLAITPSLRALVTRKLGKVRRFVNDAGISAAVILTKEKFSSVVEISLHAKGERFLHAVAKATSWEKAMTDGVAKILHQAETVKSRWQERKRRGPAARSVKRPRAARATARAAAAPAAAAKRTAGR